MSAGSWRVGRCVHCIVVELAYSLTELWHGPKPSTGVSPSVKHLVLPLSLMSQGAWLLFVRQVVFVHTVAALFLFEFEALQFSVGLPAKLRNVCYPRKTSKASPQPRSSPRPMHHARREDQRASFHPTAPVGHGHNCIERGRVRQPDQVVRRLAFPRHILQLVPAAPSPPPCI